jgi:hypothetical protein
MPFDKEKCEEMVIFEPGLTLIPGKWWPRQM